MTRPRDGRWSLAAVGLAGLAGLAAPAACGGAPAPQPGGTVRIEAAYTGADVADVERGLLVPLERAVVGVARVTGVRGVATRDGVTIEVRFERGVDRDRARAGVAEALQGSLAMLPEGTTSPMITAGRPASWIYARVSQAAAARARLEVLSTPGVIRVESCGERRPTAAIELDPRRLVAYGLSAEAVTGAITNANASVPAGRITGSGSSLVVRGSSALSSLGELAELAVDGRGTRLEDVATVRLEDVATCRVAGTGGEVLVRVGVRGGPERDEIRRQVERRLRGTGGELLARPLTLGVAELADVGRVEEALGHWPARIDGVYALAPAAAGHLVLLWPGHDPSAPGTAKTLTAPPPGPTASVARWGLAASPLVEATLVGDDLEALVRDAAAGLAKLDGEDAVAAAGCPGCRRTPTLAFELDRARVAELGASASDVARATRLVRARPVASLIDGNVIIDVTVSAGGDVSAWSELPIAAAGGTMVRIADVVRITQHEEPAEILHLDARRAVVVWAQGRPGASPASVRAALARALPGARIAAADPRELEAESWRSP